MQSGDYEAALYFPPDFAARLDAFRKAIRHRAEGSTPAGWPDDAAQARRWKCPVPKSIYNTASDKSRIAFVRLAKCCGAGPSGSATTISAAAASRLRRCGRSRSSSSDVADVEIAAAARCGRKSCPILLLLWALTGAFYPAVDLCAGEKERGTLETLLSSPAARSEIVLGKLLTDHVVQHRHRRVEPGEHGRYGPVGAWRACRASGCRR